MAYKYQPIKDEIFASEDEGDVEEFEDEDQKQQYDNAILSTLRGECPSNSGSYSKSMNNPSKGERITRELLLNNPTVVQPNSKIKQVIEQNGVLILETVETDPHGLKALPIGSTVIASGNDDSKNNLSMKSMGESILDDFATLEELEDSAVDVKPEGVDFEVPNESCHICGKQVMHLDKHILSDHGEKIECQLCNQTFAVGNLRWHILKEHCHNKVTECSLCEQKFVTKTALKNHIKQIHLSETSTCHICHKEYKDLFHHVKFFHEKIRNFECSYCEKKFQAKKLLYNHVQSIHLGEKTKCPDCKKDISVDNFTRHVKEFHEKMKKSCPHCGKEFGMSNLSRHIRQVHNNESTECPDCGRALTISNLNKHIKSVHKKLKKTCDICNEEVPYSSISVHKRKVHNIGKPIDDVTPRGPNLKLRKSYQRRQYQDEDFKKLMDRHHQAPVKMISESSGAKDQYDGLEGLISDEGEEHESRMVQVGDEQMLPEGIGARVQYNGLEGLIVECEEFEARTIQVGDKNFTFSFA